LFEPFRRGAAQQRYQGYGIGLAIAKRIIDAHGGSIVADSDPNCGARFSFTLPQSNERSQELGRPAYED
jgi:signal transduction histidine kinase